VATLEERLDNTRAENTRIDAERSKLLEAVILIDRKLAVIEDNVKELKRIVEERERRRFTIFLSVFGCLLTLAINLTLIYFRLTK
jgi:hypothetical protein